MKTTNRILGITLAIFLMAMIAMLVFIRTQISHDMVRVEGRGEVKSELRDLPAFNSVSVSGNLVLHLEQDESREVKVKAAENILELVIAEVKNGKLDLYLERPVMQHDQVEVYISLPELEELVVSRGAQAYAENPLTAENLSHTLQAGAKSELNLQVGFFDIKAQAGAVAHLKGRANRMNISSTAGAIIYAGKLLVDNCHIDASAGSLNYLHVKGSLSGRARYGALVHVEGDPDMGDYHSRHDVQYEATENGYSVVYR